MKKKKGQFMIISAVIAGLLLISVASSVNEIKNQDYSTDQTQQIVKNIRQEAAKIDITDQHERNNFRKTLSMIDGYETRADYWKRPSNPNCFNVTLRNPTTRHFLKCVG